MPYPIPDMFHANRIIRIVMREHARACKQSTTQNRMVLEQVLTNYLTNAVDDFFTDYKIVRVREED